MNFYDSEENVEQYIQMAEGYDGAMLISRLGEYLKKGNSVLEIGMGPGVDLDLLKERYKAVGSDRSELFLKRYHKTHPETDLIKLDAVTLETERKFDALFSNKVLHHLEYGRIKASLVRQAHLLKPGGILLHSFWYGEEVEEYEGLPFYQVTEESLQALIPGCFEILEMERYTEMYDDDSLYLILKLT